MDAKNFRFSVLVLALAIFAFGCSDFGNNGKTDDSPNLPTPPPEKLENPFPADFDPTKGDFSEEKMLANIGMNVIQPAVKEFRLQTELLANKTQTFCQALRGNNDSAALEEKVQEQWKETMLSFHRLGAAKVGPMSDDRGRIQGQIYAWPYVNWCGIDMQVAHLARNGSPQSQMIVSVKGLATLEYLLFEPSLKTKCNTNPSFKSAHEWSELPAGQKKKHRCDLALYLTQEVVRHAEELERGWDVKKANFSKTLIDGSRFSSLNEAMNAVSNSLFSVEDTKDLRLGKPLGLNKDCLEGDGKCPAMAEHPWSGLALEAIDAQVQSFQHVFWGSAQADGSGFGFDDALRKLGHADVADELTQSSQKIRNTIAQVRRNGSLQEQIRSFTPADVQKCKTTTVTDRHVEACALYQDVRLLTTQLKTEFLVALSLRAPPTHQGDND